MNIKVLCEDTSFRQPYEAEHGLSLLITTQTHTILFDAGQSDLFSQNAKRMGVDLSSVDVAILSHGHYDHGGGLQCFLEINNKAHIYLHEKAFGDFYNAERYIGLDKNLLQYKERFRFVSDEITIDDELTILPASNLPSAEQTVLTEKENGFVHPDPFDHELYLTVRQGPYCVLFTGCAHRGILQIAETAVCSGATHLIGGFHLTDSVADEKVQDIARRLTSLPLIYYTGHCTGEKAFAILKEHLQSRLKKLSSGDQFAISTHAEAACALFRKGYNCSQSVLGAFAEEIGMDFPTAMKVACSFGGGMGRMREVCGAVSGMLLVCGLTKGYETPETGTVKAEHYRLVQSLVKEFREKNGSIVCRELLGESVSDTPVPTARTPAFYRTRPCERMIACAATLAEKYLSD